MTTDGARAPDAAEDALRRRLCDRGVMAEMNDDAALLAWLESLSKPMEDSRNDWEKRLTTRLKEEMT